MWVSSEVNLMAPSGSRCIQRRVIRGLVKDELKRRGTECSGLLQGKLPAFIGVIDENHRIFGLHSQRLGPHLKQTNPEHKTEALLSKPHCLTLFVSRKGM